MDSSLKRVPTAYAHPKESRTLSLPTTANYISTQLKLEPLPKRYYVKPTGNSVGILKTPSTQYETIDTPSALTQRTTPRAYSRQVKISSARGVTTFNLQRSDEGHLTEFKPISSDYALEDNRADIKTERSPPAKKKTTIPPSTVMPGPRAPAEVKGFAGFAGIDFFRLVNDALNDHQRQIFEEKALLKNEHKLTKGESPRKVKTKKAAKMRKASVDLLVLSPEEKDVILEYEHEVLGTYIASENRPMTVSSKMQKKLDYLEKLKRDLIDEDSRIFLIKLVKARKSIKKSLADKDLKKVMHELNQVLNMIIEIDDIYLFLEILHLISDTYYDFGELDNALFAYNQLRMACELCNNIPKKIAAFTGMAETCKRLGYLTQALFILKRALQFAWFFKDHNKECQIYDLLGIIYYTQGDIESANYYHERCVDSKIEATNSPLRKITKGEITDYVKTSHNDFTSIEPTFFTKLSIAYKPRWLKAINSKLTKEKLRTYLHSEGQKGENYFEDEAKLSKASIFIEKLLVKARRHHGASYYSSEPSREIGTFVSAIHQLDVIFAEPDFDRNITSPRSFYRKQDQEQQIKGIKPMKTEVASSEPIDTKVSDKSSYKYLVRKVKISDAQYLDLKKDKNKYSLKQIFKEKDLTFKSVQDRVDLRLHSSNETFSFEDLRKKFKAQYTANPVNTKLFMGHLTPNRTTYGFLSVIEVKPSRCNAFFDDALEYFVNKRSRERKGST